MGSPQAVHCKSLTRVSKVFPRRRSCRQYVHKTFASQSSTCESQQASASCLETSKPDTKDLSSARATIERLYHLQSYIRTETAASFASAWRPGCFLVTVGDKPSAKNQEKCADYYANVGDAIRTLREEIPVLFQRDLTYDIYREDILFKDPRNSSQGLKNYQIIFWSLRFHGRIFFRKLHVDVRRIWSPEDGVIKMRWTVRGVPRVPWEAEGSFDGISEYKLDSSGKIYQHTVDNVVLRDPPMQRVAPYFAGLNLIPAGNQQPCPGAWRALQSRFAVQLCMLSWIRFYASTSATLHLFEMLQQHMLECESAPEAMLDF